VPISRSHSKLDNRFSQHRRQLEKRLVQLLPSTRQAPQSLHRAMHYSVHGGGKRIRPILCLEASQVVGPLPKGIEDLACAIEFIHAYSLIHDDLPALDNDDLRRGRPTCHKRFGEATAILAGDALLTLSFEIITQLEQIRPTRRNTITYELAVAAGTRGGMIGGQMADLQAENSPVSPRRLAAIHQAKTGALIRAAIRTGALYAGARQRTLDALTRYAERLGLTFQIIDDILDVQSSTGQLGKTVGKDAAHGKATYPAVHGLAKSKRLAAQLVEEACAELEPFGRRAQPLQEIARYLLTRTH